MDPVTQVQVPCGEPAPVGGGLVTWDGLTPPYSTIVVDPPWPLSKVPRRTRPNQGKRLDYSTMTMTDIANLPVGDLAADVCTLFLWTIDKYLYETRAILEGWGFSYHLTMAWDKTNGFAMYGFQRQTEFCLVGFRGKHDAYPTRRTIRTSVTSSVGRRHSVKPDAFFDMLDLLPGPRVELFARSPRLGWDSWGKGYESEVT